MRPLSMFAHALPHGGCAVMMPLQGHAHRCAQQAPRAALARSASAGSAAAAHAEPGRCGVCCRSPRAAPARAWLPDVDTDTAVSPLALPDELDVELEGRGAGAGSPADVLDLEAEGESAGEGLVELLVELREADGATAGAVLLPPPLLPVGVGVGLPEVPGEDEGEVELRAHKKLPLTHRRGTSPTSKAARRGAVRASDGLAAAPTHGQLKALATLSALTDTQGAQRGEVQSKQHHVEPSP
jgi:hypothetical protein